MPGQELIPRTALGDERLTLESLADAVGLHPDLVERFVAYGLLEQLDIGETPAYFDIAAICRLRTIRRLRDDLGINVPGIAVVLDLLQRIELLERNLTGRGLTTTQLV